MVQSTADLERPLTPEEQEQALKVMEEAERSSKEILARHGLKCVTPESWEILEELRDERSQELA